MSPTTEQERNHSQVLTSKQCLVKDELRDLLAVYNGTEVKVTQILPCPKQIQSHIFEKQPLC